MNTIFSAIGKPFRKLTPEQVALIAILLVAVILRFLHYSSFSYSNDELSAINRLRFSTFNELVQKGFYVDGHPGGIQVFLWYWSNWFGVSEASLRFPFVLFGALAVLFSYLVAKRMFGIVAGLFTAASLAFLQFPLLYSQIARPYGSGLFFCLMMVYFWLRVVFEGQDHAGIKKIKYADHIAYTLSVALCMYNHYFSFLLAAIVGISGLFFLKKGKALAYVVSGLAALMLFLPHFYITLNHLTFKGVGLWLGKPDLSWAMGHISFLLNGSTFTILLFTITSLFVSWKGKHMQTETKFLWLAFAWFCLPFLIGFVYSIYINPVLQHPVLIFSFPFLIMLLFMAGGNEFGRFQQWLLTLFLVLGIVGTVVINRYYRTQHFGEFKGVAYAIQRWEKQYGTDSITRVVIANSPYYLDYYFGVSGFKTRIDSTISENDEGVQSLVPIIRKSKKPYFLYAWTKSVPEGMNDIIMARYPYILKSIHFGKLSQVTLYGKAPGYEYEPAMKMKKLYHELLSFDSTDDPRIDPSRIQKQLSKSPCCSFQMDKDSEYSSGLEKQLDVFSNEDAIMIVAKAQVYTFADTTGAMLVVSVESKEGKPLVWESSMVDYVKEVRNWCNVQCTLLLEGTTCKEARLKVYLWNKGKEKLLIDDLEYTVLGFGNHSPFDDNQEVWGDEN